MKYDLFISHASEDKQPFADRLARALREEGYRVWYDEFVLQPGRSLRRSIDEGLAESAVGVVILSPNFFRKEWALRELDALTSQQTYDQKLLIPIWLNVTREDVARQSPLLVDRIAVPAVKGFDYVIGKIKTQINATDKLTDRELDEIVRSFFDDNPDNQSFLEHRCLANLSKLVSYSNAYEKKLDEIVSQFEDAEDDDLADAAERLMQPWHLDAVRRFEIPAQAYLDSPDSVSRDDVEELEQRLLDWCHGVLSRGDSAALFSDLDDGLDLDCLFIFFGIPNFRVSPTQRDALNHAAIDVGSRHSS
jgi:TIR domain